MHLYGALEALLPVLASSSNSSLQAEDGDSRDAPSSVAGAHDEGDNDGDDDGAAGATIRTGIGGSPLVHLVHAILLQELSPLTGTTDDRVPHAVIQVCVCLLCVALQGRDLTRACALCVYCRFFVRGSAQRLQWAMCLQRRCITHWWRHAKTQYRYYGRLS